MSKIQEVTKLFFFVFPKSCRALLIQYLLYPPKNSCCLTSNPHDAVKQGKENMLPLEEKCLPIEVIYLLEPNTPFHRQKTIYLVKSNGRIVSEGGGEEADRICQGNEAGRMGNKKSTRPSASVTTYQLHTLRKSILTSLHFRKVIVGFYQCSSPLAAHWNAWRAF